MKEELFLRPHKLTKKYFMDLPAGVYLVSNCYEMVGPHEYTPAFHEYVVHPEEREAQWKRIKAAGADHRLCNIYQSPEAYKKSLELDTKQWGKSPKFIIIEKTKDL